MTFNLYKIVFTDLTSVCIAANDPSSALSFVAKEFPDNTLHHIECSWQDVRVAVAASSLSITASVTGETGGTVFVYPTALANVSRGDTVYFVATGVPSGFKISDWQVNGVAQDVTTSEFRLDTATIEDSVTFVAVSCEIAASDDAPSSVTNFTVVPSVETATVTWVNPSENYGKTYVTVQDKLTSEFVYTQNVTSESVVVTGLTAETGYIATARVIGANGVVSEAVIAEFVTDVAPAIVPDSVTGLSASVTDGVVTARWANPITDYDHLVATLKEDSVVRQSKELAPTLTDCVFDPITYTGTLTVSVVTVNVTGEQSTVVAVDVQDA